MGSMAMLRGTFAFVCLLAAAEATFSQNFRSFLTTTFGAEVEKNLSRADLGEWGSFGGGEHTAGVRTGKIAVIFVHGMTGSAESMRGNRDYLLWTYKYSDPEIYATSYGNRAWDSLRCEYIKHVRQLIVAVYQFSGSQRVNIIAHSHGVPITRKAILGGKCVDTGEDLGPSLTNSVQKYVSLAGPNRGALFCTKGQNPGNVCDSVTGVAPDNGFITDINRKVHYEGQETYAVISKADETVGYNHNGIILSRLPGADKTYEFDNFAHDEVNSKTYATQYEILMGSAPSVFGCASTNLTDAHRQKLLDYHNGFRSNVAKGVAILDREGHNFTFPTAKDMFKVKYSCELEEHANSRAQQCTFQPSAANNAAGVTLAGGYYRIAGGHAGNYYTAFYDTFRKWLWEFYNQRESTAPLTTYNGFDGAQFLIHNNLEIGCAIRQDCWLDMDGDGTRENKTQVVVCAYRNRASVASEVYPKGPACATDANCTFYPAKCLADGLCDLKSQPPPFGQLSVNGNKLVGEFGQTVRLRGMSMWGTNKFNRDRFFNLDTVRALRCNWLTNVVRAVIDPGTNGTGVDDPALPPRSECTVPEPNNCGGGYIYHSRQQYRQPDKNVDLRIFEQVVKAAIEVGMYVIIDWHGIYTPTFWQPSARQFFTYVAKKYHVFPHVLYETFNEPMSALGVAHVDAWKNEIKPYHEMIIPVIRNFDKKNVIILGTPEFSGIPEVVVNNPIVGQPNIAFTWHFYMAKPDKPFDGKGRQAAVRSVLDSNRLVFVTEYGTTDGTGRTNYNPEAMKKWWAFLDELGLSYTNWAVNDQSWDGTGANYPTGTAAFTNPTNGSEVGLDSHLTPDGVLVKGHIGKDNGVLPC